MLDGVLVLDLSRVLAGPYCTQTLADLGARVIKVEPLAGDETRRWGQEASGAGTDVSAYYLSTNRGKESLAVDLKQASGRAIVTEIARRADVFVENARTGKLGQLGLDYASLAPDNPGLVYLSITGYGQDGPRATEPGYDAAMQAHSGLMAMTGHPGEPPVKLGVAWVDVMTGSHAATAVLAALVARGRSGKGAYIDLSMFEVALGAMANQGQEVLMTGRAPERLGSAHPSIVPYQAFATADGAMVIAVGTDRQFQRMCDAIGLDLAEDAPRFATNALRVRNRDELVLRMDERLRSRPRATWLEALGAAGVPATAVATLPEALADPQAEARGVVRTLHHPVVGALPMVGGPFRHLRSAAGETWEGMAGAAPPLLGQHTRDILERDLGMSADEVDELERAGVVASSRA